MLEANLAAIPEVQTVIVRIISSVNGTTTQLMEPLFFDIVF